ncbi:MAG TPA: uracil-DNA glycosylase family protein [Lentimicrobium sp.]|nr:uracil-DNA glycosylase family protein [Lentimicrobium sp.]
MKTNTFGDRVTKYLVTLEYPGSLPEGIRILNPYQESKEVGRIVDEFYKKYYSDLNIRQLILGINPGRFGAGHTGIPFTDPKHLEKNCDIKFYGQHTHETSSVFIYDKIRAYGSIESFYSKFYIGAVCPLGFVATDKGREVNFNYYDTSELQSMVMDFILQNIKKQIELGIDTRVCYCLGTGKNYQFLLKINNKFQFFASVIPLAHPRYIMQYKSKMKNTYIDRYLQVFKENEYKDGLKSE